MPIIVPTPDPPGEDYRVKAPTDAFVVGPHSIFTRNGIVLNDRDQHECYWVQGITGFGKADIRSSAEENPQDHGETPLPAFYGGRTMTLTGWIECGSYPAMMEMTRALEDSLLDLVEMPMVISVKDGGFFTQPPIQIYCRPTDYEVARDIKQTDLSGQLKRDFTIALRASWPFYESVELHQEVMVPTIVSELGMVFDVTFDLLFATTMDEHGNPTASANSLVVHNSGNGQARPIFRFHGAMGGISLTNNANGHVLRLTDSIVQGDWIEVDIAGGGGIGTVVDSLGNDAFRIWDSTSDWLKLEGERGAYDGDNELILAVQDLGDGAQLDVSWRDTYAGG